MTTVKRICDFRSGCKIIGGVFRDDAQLAEAAIQATPHLAEALFALGMTRQTEAIDMALAIQEARLCPFADCACLLLCQVEAAG